MSDILVTQAAVRNLATILSRGDTQGLKHTERLALIAGAFGWKPDAFMHSLKSQNARMVPPATPGSPLLIDRTFVATEATKKALQNVIETLTTSGGMFVVAGPAKSGKTTTIKQAILRLEELGWQQSSAVRMLSNKHFEVFEDVCGNLGLIRAIELAKRGGIALVSIAVLAPLYLVKIGENGDDIFRHLKGVMCQRLLRTMCQSCIQKARCCDACDVGQSDDHVLVADVVELDFAKSPFDYRAFAKTDARFIRDGIRAVLENLTGIREVERAFGRELVSAHHAQSAARTEALIASRT